MLSNQGADLNPNMIMQTQRDAYKLYVHKYNNIVYFKLNTALNQTTIQTSLYHKLKILHPLHNTTCTTMSYHNHQHTSHSNRDIIQVYTHTLHTWSIDDYLHTVPVIHIPTYFWGNICCSSCNPLYCNSIPLSTLYFLLSSL